MYAKLFSALDRVALRNEGPVSVFRRYASLSAIHRGLRRSQGSSRSGPSRGGRSRPGPGYTERTRSVPASGTRLSIQDGGGPRMAPKLNYKERKDILDEHQKLRDRIGSKRVKGPAIPQALTRRARFLSPDTKFGKKSIVYQAKSGQLQEEIRKLEGQLREAGGEADGPAPPRQPYKFESSEPTRSRSRERLPRRSHSERTPDHRSGRGRGSGRTETRENILTAEEFARGFERAGPTGGVQDTSSSVSHEERSRGRSDDGKSETWGHGRDRSRNREESIPHARSDSISDGRPRRGRDEDSTESRPRRFSDDDSPDGRGRAVWTRKRSASLRPEEDTTERRVQSRARSFAGRRPDVPIAARSRAVSVPYTTAASQFLYGKSEVEAAMLAGRRQLYKLYIYGGENRQDVQRDAAIERLATWKGVKTVVVRGDGLQMLDKMAGGRPHNGYVLEASPLPQRLLTALGSVSTDAGRPGFHVMGAHQSAEDARINGTGTFFASRAGTHKPFVLALDQIVDPGNLGAILRSASFLGADAVVISRRGSATLTPVALKASSGAAESMTIFTVDNMLAFLSTSQEEGWKVYAAAPAPATARSWRARHFDLHSVQHADPLATDPCILLVGNEGEGLSRQLKHKADYEVNIPNLSGAENVDSLNVSVATALLCSAFLSGQVRKKLEALAQVKAEDALF